MSDEAEDLRHDGAYVPPIALERNPFKTDMENARDYLRAVASGDVANVQFDPRLAQSIRLLLKSTAPAPADLTHLRPKPEGLAYADPAGKFECNPAANGFTGEGLSTLELRVLAAHLTTALDTVTAELTKRM